MTRLAHRRARRAAWRSPPAPRNAARLHRRSAFGQLVEQRGGRRAWRRVALTAGDALHRHRSASDDLWNAGALPRWSERRRPRPATGSPTGTDESGEAAGTLIGHGLRPAGCQRLLRALRDAWWARSAAVWAATACWDELQRARPGTPGRSNLFYLGCYNSFDNTRLDRPLDVAAATAVVPEPATWALMIGGFGMAGAMLRRRRAHRAGRLTLPARPAPWASAHGR